MKDGDAVLFWTFFGIGLLVFAIGFVCGKWWERGK